MTGAWTNNLYYDIIILLSCSVIIFNVCYKGYEIYKNCYWNTRENRPRPETVSV